uniref:CHK kinase-like domain-containing protein n=1 Tax=Plectus sambesii TaxID=2011161 RepID=A0A914UZF7_9BILA
MVEKDKLKVNVPKCYFTEPFGPNGENELLIMEDLSRCAAIKPIYEGLSAESVKSVLDNLAEVHAYSLLHDQWLSDPDMKMTYLTFQKQLGGGGTEQFSNTVVSMMNVLKKEHPAVFDPLIDLFLDSCSQKFNFGESYTLHEKLGLPPVLTHGDLWMNNIMWRKTEDGKSTTDELVAIVDWQVCSVEPDVRREHLDDFLQHYHSYLKWKLGREPQFTVGQMANAYKHLFRDGVIMNLPNLGAFLQAELGMMGIENVEQQKQDVIHRAKCLVEDMHALEDEFYSH